MKETSNGRDTTEIFSDHGGYFDVVVKPMLQQGHEGELCSWLKEMSLIRTTYACPRIECYGRSLTWHAARVVDKYNWNCTDCNKKQSIRVSSFFLGVKCDFKTCLQIVLAWCQLIPSEIVAGYLGIKEHVIKKVYERCAKVADIYVKTHPEDFKLGGPGRVVVVDEYPSGYMTENIMDHTTSRKRNNNAYTILCMAEAEAIPPRMWLHFIAGGTTNKNHSDANHCGKVEEALNEIVRLALPGSFIVANYRARCCNYESIKELAQYSVTSIEYLQKFDMPGTNKLLSNIETIWQTGVEVCEEVQESTNALGRQIISTFLWRQRFAATPSVAFEFLLNHIAEAYKFT